MEPIQSFSLEEHSGPYASWPRETRLYFNGADTGATVTGYVIDGQYQTGNCYLLILSYDCPFEESSDFMLLNRAYEVVAKASLGAMYDSYLLDTHWPASASAVRLHYYDSEIHELCIEGGSPDNGRGCRLKLQQIIDYASDEKSVNAVVDLQLRLMQVEKPGKAEDQPTQDTWRRAWHELGATHCDDQTLRDVIVAHAQPHRAYHVYRHIVECFRVFGKLDHLAQRPWEVRVALWFHDAIYDPKRDDNELRSAEWAKRTTIRFGVDPAVADRIHALIMATRHLAVPADHDQQLLVDVDLSILGAERDQFSSYERQIRWEYRRVPALLFNLKRKAILKQFLAREWIYNTTQCREMYEQRARENIARSIRGGKLRVAGKLKWAAIMVGAVLIAGVLVAMT